MAKFLIIARARPNLEKIKFYLDKIFQNSYKKVKWTEKI